MRIASPGGAFATENEIRRARVTAHQGLPSGDNDVMPVRRTASLALPAFAVAALAASVLTSPVAKADIPTSPAPPTNATPTTNAAPSTSATPSSAPPTNATPTTNATPSTSATPSSAPPASTPRADVPAPEAGTCWNYTYRQAALTSYSGTPVDCDEPHTVETVITLDVPRALAARGNSSPEVVLWMDQRCQPEVNRYAGVANPATAAPGTRTWFLWYTPSAQQWKAGAHWVSCAASSVPADEKRRGKLIPVRGSIAGDAAASKPITFRTDFGLGTYTARKPLTSLANRPYPGSSGLQRKAAGFCEKTLGHKRFFWYGPSETEWLAGYTAVRCYSLKKS